MTRGAATRVLLIGGTSHVGKSTVGARLADVLGWQLLSTDQLARHPGRPWRDDGSPLPADVVAYYSLGSTQERLASVLQHYESNVWPVVEALVRSRVNNAYDRPLVLEGSAILPRLALGAVARGDLPRTCCAWLAAPARSLAERIRASSGHEHRSADEQRWIQAFIDRAVAFQEEQARALAERGARPLEGRPDAVLTALRERIEWGEGRGTD